MQRTFVGATWGCSVAQPSVVILQSVAEQGSSIPVPFRYDVLLQK